MAVRVLTFCILSNHFHFLPEYVRLRMRSFADGTAGHAGVCGVFQALRSRWGSNRTDGARPVQGLTTDLCVLRDLRMQVFG